MRKFNHRSKTEFSKRPTHPEPRLLRQGAFLLGIILFGNICAGIMVNHSAYGQGCAPAALVQAPNVTGTITETETWNRSFPCYFGAAQTCTDSGQDTFSMVATLHPVSGYGGCAFVFSTNSAADFQQITGTHVETKTVYCGGDDSIHTETEQGSNLTSPSAELDSDPLGDNGSQTPNLGYRFSGTARLTNTISMDGPCGGTGTTSYPVGGSSGELPLTAFNAVTIDLPWPTSGAVLSGDYEDFTTTGCPNSACSLTWNFSPGTATPTPTPTPTPIPTPTPSPTPTSTPTPDLCTGPSDPCIQAREDPVLGCVTDDGRNYNPDFWNNDWITLVENNCYAYATNKATDTFAQPGRGAGISGFTQDSDFSCENITALAIVDGLEPTGDCNGVCPNGGRTIALVVDPVGLDYHWYRRDSDGFWSHKPGTTDVTNLDASGNFIADPRIANRNYNQVGVNYSDFCTCFCTPSDCEETIK